MYNLIGETNHSFVYLVRHRCLGVLRIAKVIAKDTPDCERILREADILKSLRHPGIPSIYDIRQDDISICIIEEYIYGNSLTEYVASKGQVELCDIIHIISKLCDILEYLHNLENMKIIHLDLKPDNIMIDGNNNVRLIDFDGSVFEGEAVSDYYGTRGFASPEQYHKLKFDTRADIYSLGMLIMYMDTGHIQSDTENVYHKQLYPIIRKCIHHNPAQRFRNVEVLKKELGGIDKNIKQLNICKPVKVIVRGTKSGVGVTHISLCISSFLQRKGFRVLCVKSGNNTDIVSEARKGYLTEGGFYTYKGIDICPDYNGGIVTDTSKYDFVVTDGGVSPALNSQEGSSFCSSTSYDTPDDTSYSSDLHKTIFILVSEFGYRLQEELNCIRGAGKDDYIFVNFTDGQKFYRVIKEAGIDGRIYRMPLLYNWWDKSEIFDRAMKEIVEESCRDYVFTERWRNRAGAWLYQRFKGTGKKKI